MLAHGLAIDPSRTLRCPATSKVSTAPLGLVTSLSFNRRCKEKNKVFINVDRYTKYSTPFCYAQRNARIIPLATASFGDMADSTREYLLTMSMTRRSYIISSYTDGHGRTQGPATLGTSPGSGVMTARGMLNLREASYSKWLPRRLRKRWIS